MGLQELYGAFELVRESIDTWNAREFRYYLNYSRNAKEFRFYLNYPRIF